MIDPSVFENEDFSAEVARSEPAAWEPSAMSAFTTRLPKATLESLRGIARERGVTTGQVIRDILVEAVREEAGEEKTVPVSALRALIAQAS